MQLVAHFRAHEANCRAFCARFYAPTISTQARFYRGGGQKVNCWQNLSWGASRRFHFNPHPPTTAVYFLKRWQPCAEQRHARKAAAHLSARNETTLKLLFNWSARACVIGGNKKTTPNSLVLSQANFFKEAAKACRSGRLLSQPAAYNSSPSRAQLFFFFLFHVQICRCRGVTHSKSLE